MSQIFDFLTRTRGRNGSLHFIDYLTYAYLLLGVFLMFFPVIWLAFSSFKSEAGIAEYPPTLLPLSPKETEVPGREGTFPIMRVLEGEHAGKELPQIRRIGIESQLVDPANPKDLIKVNVKEREPVRQFKVHWENYTELFSRFNILNNFYNSAFITIIATLITLLINSMAAFALSKYQFPGRNATFVVIIATLMIPYTITLIPTYIVINQIGLVDSLWGVIWPAVATPTGVFLLRQYMLTIPDELLEAARMDNASEWRIYWRIILPLSTPALAVLAIFSIIWRWNEFLWPLIILNSGDNFTLQIALNSLQGELQTQWTNLLAMTIMVMLPVLLSFGILQKHIATGIARTGLK